MKINIFTNLSFRVLIYLALNKNNLSSTSQIAEAYQVSFNHLKKVIQLLASAGFVKTTKGRNGGIELAKATSAINLGDVFRLTIEDVAIAECFASPTNNCVISPDCRLRDILQDARSKFIGELDAYSLEDLIVGRDNALKQQLSIEI